jgi:hypothetical protein
MGRWLRISGEARIAQRAAAQHGWPLAKMPFPNGGRDRFLVDTFAVLAARYCMQKVSTHH